MITEKVMWYVICGKWYVVCDKWEALNPNPQIQTPNT
jgi:hypothetical protein